ncbi:methyltransferase family protein [Enteractinococcus fodinae]|uniref:methyltransferase family protein n=1 Tax=Enteractinococcus fodinae TaxID=684663 RepID=UPI00286D5A41|nr:isoprenylcysteine carboxylmethyltransferase family protein [Enteractinococcus fodinae]
MGRKNDQSNAGGALPKGHVPPPVLAAVAFGAQRLVSRRKSSTKTSRLSGALLVVGSGVLMGSAVIQFRRSHTTVNPKTLDTTALVVTGPYKLTRNPMYVGMTGLLVAHALTRRSWLALVPAGLFAVTMNQIQIPAEEAVLQQRFGASFERYRGNVPRWLGKLQNVRY